MKVFLHNAFFIVYLLFHFAPDDGWDHQCFSLEQRGATKAKLRKTGGGGGAGRCPYRIKRIGKYSDGDPKNLDYGSSWIFLSH